MSATYPSGVKTFTPIQDGIDRTQASQVNQVYDEVTALENALLNGVAHPLKPSTDATQDVGSASKQFKDLYVSGNIYQGGSVLALVGLPIGFGGLWFTNTPPTDYILCNGSAVSRAAYPDLYALWGTTFGAGDGSTTFGTPDLRQRFPIGKAASGTGSNLGDTGGAIDHTHAFSATTGNPSGGPDNNGSLGSVAVSVYPHTHAVTGTTGATNPPFLVVNFAVRAR
jgi:microcystin-dependent protein